MKERPILMSAPMVRAVLNGQKTQTRRMVKPQPVGLLHGYPVKSFDEPSEILCPYGRPGDHLWVRETWGHVEVSERYVYRADPASDYQWGNGKNSQGGFRWRPSIHMRRSVSRITLELTKIWCEPLQDISGEDARAEGAEREIRTFGPAIGQKESTQHTTTYREGFQRIWETINGVKSWQQNPLVWVLEFKRVKP